LRARSGRSREVSFIRAIAGSDVAARIWDTIEARLEINFLRRLRGRAVLLRAFQNLIPLASLPKRAQPVGARIRPVDRYVGQRTYKSHKK
jgi:hypothetical protein